jgi:hypothetical protein
MQHAITLNIPIDSPPGDWDAIARVYPTLPGWLATTEWPSWFGQEGDPRFISVSAEPSGLLFTCEADNDFWTGWVSVLCARLSLALGREVRDASI